MVRRAHHNKKSVSSSSSSSSFSKNISVKPDGQVMSKKISETAQIKHHVSEEKCTEKVKSVVAESPEEIFYMTENGIDLKAMYPDIQLFENAIKYGVGSWYDLGEKYTRIEKSAPKRNVRIIETTEAELHKIRVKEYVDKFVAHINKIPENRRTFINLVNIIILNVEQIPEKYRDDVIENVSKVIDDNKMYIDTPPMPSVHMPPVHIEQIQAVDEQIQAIDEQTQAIDEQTQAIDEQTQAVDEQIQAVDEQTQAVDEQTKYVLVPLHLLQSSLASGNELMYYETKAEAPCEDNNSYATTEESYASISLYTIAASYESLCDDERVELLNIISRIIGYPAEIQATTNYLKRCVHITCFQHHQRADFLTLTDGNIMMVDSARYIDQQRALVVMNNCSKFNAGELPMQDEPQDFWSEHYMTICTGWIAASAAAFMAFY